MRDIDEIFIHCSATMPHVDIGAEDIRAWHKARGWRDIGYHWVIRRDGTVEAGRHEAVIGAHVRAHNRNSIGVCLVGGIGEDQSPEPNYTEEQWDELEGLVRELMDRYPQASVRGHNEVSAKACPCFDVKMWVKDIIRNDPVMCPQCGREMPE